MTSQTLAADLLIGADAIAKFTGFSTNQVYHLHRQKRIHTFKIGAMICARRSELDAAYSANPRAA
jgi:hypothetical protein